MRLPHSARESQTLTGVIDVIYNSLNLWTKSFYYNLLSDIQNNLTFLTLHFLSFSTLLITELKLDLLWRCSRRGFSFSQEDVSSAVMQEAYLLVACLALRPVILALPLFPNMTLSRDPVYKWLPLCRLLMPKSSPLVSLASASETSLSTSPPWIICEKGFLWWWKVSCNPTL